MVCGDARRLLVLQRHLYTVVARPGDIHRTALHKEVLVAVDTVLQSALHVDGAVLDLNILLAPDAMGGLAVDGECALALELGVALADEASLPVATSAVGEAVGRLVLDAEVDALAVLDVDGRTIGIGQIESVEGDAALIAAAEIEAAIGG